MKKKHFTIEDIETYLKELDFEWIEKYVYLTEHKTYERATLCMFKMQPVYLYLKNRINNRKGLVLVQITNDEFHLIYDTSKMNASKAWKDLLETKQLKEIV